MEASKALNCGQISQLELLGQLSGPVAMLGDRQLLDSTQWAGGRLYQWDKICVSLGKNQNPEQALIDPSRTDWVRRPTGGKAVLHGHDWTVAICLSSSFLVKSEIPLRAVKQIYEVITQPVLRGLNECGLKTRLGGDSNNEVDHQARLVTEDCFAATSRYDLVSEANGLKIGGCAMVVTQKGALLQASIPLRNPEISWDQLITGASTHPVPDWNYLAFPQKITASFNELFHEAV